MSNHTPGPWTLSDERQQDGQFVVQCPTNVPDALGTVAIAGYKPNAHLVAAAPDLLAACKILAALAYSLMSPASLPATYHQAVQAIERAEGRSR